MSRDPLESNFPFQSPYCYAADNPIRFIEVNGEGPGLDLKTLKANPSYVGLTVRQIRDMVRQEYPSLENFKINISAGHLLENAYAQFSGFAKNRETMLSSVSWFGIRGVKPRFIKPDFVQPTEYMDPAEGQLHFPYGGYYEVTATDQVVTLKIKDKQIEAYFNKLPYAMTWSAKHEAGDFKSAQLTLVVPYGTTVDDEVIKMADNNGVNLYVSYAFINVKTHEIVFSNPEKINNKLKNHEVPYPDIGNINHPANPDPKKAGGIWKDKDPSSKTNESDQ